VQEWGRDLLHLTFRDSLLNLDYACDECAHLSEADGVTVLSHDFEILGFGASIAAPDQQMPDDWMEYLRTRGNRHRSMANAVASMDGSIGIVISQDGGVTIFINHDGHDKHLIILAI
jgi:DNA integrity scanning protein DisA with diadenylate cyclase activity